MLCIDRESRFDKYLLLTKLIWGKYKSALNWERNIQQCWQLGNSGLELLADNDVDHVNDSDDDDCDDNDADNDDDDDDDLVSISLSPLSHPDFTGIGTLH